MGKRIIKLTESDLRLIVKRVLKESITETGPGEEERITTSTQNGNLPISNLDYIVDPKGRKSNILLDKQASKDFNDMVIVAKNNDFNDKEGSVDITVSQGYREIGSKERGCLDGFTQWCAWLKWNQNPKYAARPGTSNHGWGKAVDVENCRKGGKVHNWLSKYGKYFGFFPYTAEDWHWDYKPEKKELPPKMDILPHQEIPIKDKYKFYNEPLVDLKTLSHEVMNSNIDRPDTINLTSKRKK